MNIEEYKTKKNKIELKYKNEFYQLGKEYAIYNNTVNIGDIITDHYQTIKVESIKYEVPLYEEPRCVYYGVLVNKDGTVSKKKNNKSYVYQTNLNK